MKLYLLIALSILLTSCIKNVDDTKAGSEPTTKPLTLRDVVIERNFDFSASQKVRVNIFTNDLVKIDLYELQKDQSEKKHISSYVISQNTSFSHTLEKKNDEIFAVITTKKSVNYIKRQINNGFVDFDLRL